MVSKIGITIINKVQNTLNLVVHAILDQIYCYVDIFVSK